MPYLHPENRHRTDRNSLNCNAIPPPYIQPVWRYSFVQTSATRPAVRYLRPPVCAYRVGNLGSCASVSGHTQDRPTSSRSSFILLHLSKMRKWFLCFSISLSQKLISTTKENDRPRGSVISLWLCAGADALSPYFCRAGAAVTAGAYDKECTPWSCRKPRHALRRF